MIIFLSLLFIIPTLIYSLVFKTFSQLMYIFNYLITIFSSMYIVNRNYEINKIENRPFINVLHTHHIDVHDTLYYSECLSGLYDDSNLIILSNPSGNLATDLLMKINDINNNCIDIVEVDYIKDKSVFVLPKSSEIISSIEIAFKYEHDEFGYYKKFFNTDNNFFYNFDWKKIAKNNYNSILDNYHKSNKKSLHRLVLTKDQIDRRNINPVIK